MIIMRILLVGHGRLGRAVEALCPAFGAELAGVLDETNNAGGCALVADRWRGVDVVIDASTPAAFLENVRGLVRLGANLVVGTTGWQLHEASVREAVAAAGLGAGLATVKATAIAFGIVLHLRRVHNLVALLTAIYFALAILPWAAIFLTH
jgi:dihydrodipicolinate reductase